jgi:hypothetical protein
VNYLDQLRKAEAMLAEHRRHEREALRYAQEHGATINAMTHDDIHVEWPAGTPSEVVAQFVSILKGDVP